MGEAGEGDATAISTERDERGPVTTVNLLGGRGRRCVWEEVDALALLRLLSRGDAEGRVQQVPSPREFQHTAPTNYPERSLDSGTQVSVCWMRRIHVHCIFHFRRMLAFRMLACMPRVPTVGRKEPNTLPTCK